MSRQPDHRPHRSHDLTRRTLLLAGAVGLLIVTPRPALTADAPPPPPKVKTIQLVPDELLGPPGSAQIAPALKGVDLDGKELDLNTLLPQGPVLISFWALWCKPCLKELPALDKLVGEYAERGVRMVAVNGDAPGDGAKVRPFVKSRGFHFRVVPDQDGEIRRSFSVNTLPTTILLGPDGATLWTNQGYRPGDEKELRKVLDTYFEAPGLKEPESR